MNAILGSVACALMLFSGIAAAQEVNGTLVVNGKSAVLKYAVAQEVDSSTEKGYMDVIVVLSDRKVGLADARNTERLEAMTRNDGLAALVVRLNPDATTFLSSAAFIRWKPSAYDEKRVAGRFWTEGTQNEFRQRWSYDATFSAPITLDPDAKTVPKN